MTLPASPLSTVGRSIADFIADRLDATQNNVHVGIGNPAEMAPQEGDADHRLSLFFYSIEPGGFQADVSPGEPWMLRLHCLITAFGVLEDSVSGGENDLRLLGEVVRIFHETPVLDAIDVAGETTRARVVFDQLSLDQVNQIWSTQNEVSYRPSVAYEIALIPIVPSVPAVEAPIAGSLGLEVRASMAARAADFRGSPRAPTVVAVEVDTGLPGWEPRIAFVHDGAYAETLVFQVGSPELTAFTPLVLVAGESGETATLVWEIWDASAGWRRAGADVDTIIQTPTIDPLDVDAGAAQLVDLPFDDRGGQAVLYARRSFQRASDGVTVEMRSNPLLVSLFGPAP